MTEEHVFDLIPAYTLGTLDDDEIVHVDKHLSACKTCQAEVQSYQLVINDLPLGTSLSSPPRGLKSKILSQAIQLEKASESREEIGFWESLRKAYYSLAPTWGVASLVIVLALFVSNILLWQQFNNLTQSNKGILASIEMIGSEITPDATGKLVTSVDGEYGVLVVDRLPQLDSKEQYQLWLIKDGDRTDGGVFSVNEEGYGALFVSSELPLSYYSAFGVTVEPAGGSPGPTGAKVLGGES